MEGIRSDLPDQKMFIEWHGSAGFPTLHKNILRDPDDGEQLRALDYTPAERGHEYRYRLTQGGAIIYMPKRVMDEETWAVLRKFESVRGVEPLYKLPTAAKRAKMAYYIWQHFYLDSDDFALFKTAAIKAKWVLESGHYSAREVTSDALTMQTRLETWVVDVRALRSMTLPGGMREVPIATASSTLERVLDGRAVLSKEYRDYASKLLSWRSNLTAAELLRLAPVFSAVQVAADVLLGTDIAELSDGVRDAIAGYALAPTPASFAQLRNILAELQSQYHVLNILSVDAENGLLIVTAGGGRLTYDGYTTDVQAPFTNTKTGYDTVVQPKGLLFKTGRVL